MQKLTPAFQTSNPLYIFLGILALIFSVYAQSKNSSLEKSWAEEIISRMSLREKIGQLFIATIAEETTLTHKNSMSACQSDPVYIKQLIENHNVGGILFLGTSTIQKQIELTRRYQNYSAIPLLVLEDLEWGLETRLSDAIRFPRNITLGAIQNEQLIYEMGYEIGKQCQAIGVHINLAPVIDINNNPLNPVIGRRSFGEDHVHVAQRGKLYMQGMQDAGILSCAKHFPGHGDTHQDSHVTLPVINHDKKHLESIELYPFKEAINAGVDALMIGHLRVPALDQNSIAPFSYPIVTDLLKNELGFKGLIITDALNMGALSGYKPGEVELRAFLAGCDVFLCSLDIPQAIATLEHAVAIGIISEAEVTTRVFKVLCAKEQVKLNKHKYNKYTRQLLVNNPCAHALKKRLFEEAITVVQNN